MDSYSSVNYQYTPGSETHTQDDEGDDDDDDDDADHSCEHKKRAHISQGTALCYACHRELQEAGEL